jgi:hypothetical protein
MPVNKMILSIVDWKACWIGLILYEIFFWEIIISIHHFKSIFVTLSFIRKFFGQTLILMYLMDKISSKNFMH